MFIQVEIKAYQRPYNASNYCADKTINPSVPKCDQLNDIFHNLLYIGHWLPKPILTVREPLIYHQICLTLLAPP